MRGTCAWRPAVLAGALGAVLLLGAQAGAIVLYGAQGSGVSADLYTIDPATGAATGIGPIGFSVTGLAEHPVTGVLYATTSSNDATARTLITIDPVSGDGTSVGPLGLPFASVAGLTFAADGTLYGWSEATDQLVTIDLVAGTATPVGGGILSAGSGLAFDAAGTLYFAGDYSTAVPPSLSIVDPATGDRVMEVGPLNLAFSDMGALAFHPVTGVLYGLDKGSGGGAAQLATVDLATGASTPIGPTENAMDALAFASLCGDAEVDPRETCDDGNTIGNDGCDMDCQVECGNGLPNVGEACDDGNVVDGDGCSADCQTVTYCLPGPDPACIDAEKGSLSIKESKPGSEKLKASIKGLSDSTDLGDFGDPVGGTTVYEICIFDQAGARVANLRVARAGDTCGAKAKPCWKTKGSSGYAYKDPDAESAGVQKIATKAGAEGKGKLTVQAGNKAKKGQDHLPTGIAAALAGDSSATVEVQTSNAACFAADLTEVKKSDTTQFKAK